MKITQSHINAVVASASEVVVAIATHDPTAATPTAARVAVSATGWLSRLTTRRDIARNLERLAVGDISDEHFCDLVALATQTVESSLNAALYVEHRGDKEQIILDLTSRLRAEHSGDRGTLEQIVRVIVRTSLRALAEDPALHAITSGYLAEDARRRRIPSTARLEKLDPSRDYTVGVSSLLGSHLLSDHRSQSRYYGIDKYSLLSAIRADWRRDVTSAIAELPQATDRALAAKIDRLRDIDIRGTFASVLAQLRSEMAASSLNDVRASKAHQYEQASDWHRCVAAATRLTQWLSDPHAGGTLPVFGQWGSGKARIVKELVSDWAGLNLPVLKLPEFASTGLESEILRLCPEFLGRAPANRIDLASYVNSSFSGPLLIIVERLDLIESRHEGATHELVSLIDRWSDSSAFRWLVTMDQSSMPYLEGLSDFWPTFGLSAASQVGAKYVAGGWLDLDLWNQREHIGVQLLTTELPPSGRKRELASALGAGAVPDHILLAVNNPEAAWLRIESSDQRPIDALRGADFHDLFWSATKRELASAGCKAPVVESYVQAVARGLVDSPTPLLSQIEAYIVPPPEYIPDYRSQIRGAREGLLRCGLIDITAQHVEIPLEYIEVWASMTASSITSSATQLDAMLDSVSDLDTRAERGDHLASLCLAKLLEVLASADTELTGVLVSSITHQPAIWESVLHLEHDALRAFITGQSRIPEAFRDRRTAYLALRVARMRDMQDSPTRLSMLRVISRAYPQVREAALGGYCAGAIETQLEGIDWREEEGAIAALAAVGDLGIPGIDFSLGLLAADSVRGSIGARAALYLARKYLESPFTPISSHQVDDPLASQLRFTYPFWRSFARALLRESFKSDGPSLVIELAQSGWLGELRAPEAVRVAVKREATVAFGHSFKTDQETFVHVVERMAEGRVHGVPRLVQQEAALFGIRHTVATDQHVVYVDRELRRAIYSLARDSTFTDWFGKWLHTVQKEPYDGRSSSPRSGQPKGERRRQSHRHKR